MPLLSPLKKNEIAGIGCFVIQGKPKTKTIQGKLGT
jgi:hypothetical protein